MKYRDLNFHLRIPQPETHFDKRLLTGWLPTRGNVIFTLLMIALLVAAQTVGALPLGRPQAAPSASSTSTIAYQGRLADSAGAPLTGTYNMIFRLYAASSGGTPLWEEQWTGSNGVKVSDGLFNVMLGSLTSIPQAVITGHDQLFLGITVGTDDEMAPRVQLGSVPFAVQALTVPDGSVTTAKIADGAVAQVKLGSDVSLTPPDGSITTAKLANGAVTSTKLNLVDGNIGIGTTDPDEKLTVKGYIKMMYPAANEGGGLIMMAGNGALGQIYVVDDAWPCSNGGGVTIASDDGVNLCFRRKCPNREVGRRRSPRMGLRGFRALSAS